MQSEHLTFGKAAIVIVGAACSSVAVCTLVLLQSAGIVRPVGVGWGDGARGSAYSIELRGPIVVRTASGIKPAPPGNYAYGVQSLADSENVGVTYHRWNMTAGRTPQAPVLGTFAEVRLAPAWPILISLALVWLPVMLGAKRRRTARRANRCLACGYDLRATPDRCPECGSVPPAPPAA